MPVSAANGAHAAVVLVVEDEFFVRCSIADCLRDAGYCVLETASGEEAIALCKSSRLIDMVFTDINLTGAASGWDVGECFRADRPNVPVLYIRRENRLIMDAVFPGARSLPSPIDDATS